ncbi:protein-glutamine gamma-glutamyltransferase [Anaerotignum neopropionicum]|uniref:Protein-glutamine gamma-glutamyltransferase n=1 Tax=Anaerotignum neopropionicum TaxID=36847 RepID=A0A136WFL7_9FIRM|nr:transglutaminase domain-containing protein [Anaerotignum neopropionicum]KXL53240.1 protein-glutamine gamma-glutamyltransferase [Anaerotignum neopropionicum]
MKKNIFKNTILYFSVIALFLLGCGNATSAIAQEEGTAMFPLELYSEANSVSLEEALGEPMVPLAGDPKAAVIQAPQASGKVVYTSSGNNDVTMDASNSADGYIMVKYTGSASVKLKLILSGPSGIKYTYNLNSNGNYETFILSNGSGNYTVGVYKNIVDTKYSTLFTKSFQVTLKDEFAPFLRPNQYVNFNANSQVVTMAASLVKDSKNDIEKVQSIYDYVVKNITYDKQLAQTVQSGYVPVVDDVLMNKKGICFDYAAVMAAMLRSQGIPTKLVTGYTGSAYHAWISTYSKETGWVEGIIFFDGTTWRLMDPTFASTGNSSDAIMKYIGDGKNYQEKYLY